jgi:hypothetical protein
MLRQGAHRTEQAVGRAREVGQGLADQAGRVVERTREVGGSVAENTQSLVDRVQKRVNRG